MKDHDKIVLKFGSTQEALESLGQCYKIDLDIIKSKLPQIRSYYKEYFKHENKNLLLQAISILLINKIEIDISFNTFRVHFYHRTSYNGNINWFSKGLLCGSEGIKQYVQNLHDLSPDLNLIQHQKNLADANNRKHIFNPINDEVYAFLNLKSAKLLENHFYNYSEIVYDYTRDNPKLLQDIKILVKPCIVEFYLEKNHSFLHEYLFNYWELLLNQSDEKCNGVSSGSKGHVPFENIISVEYI